MTKINTNMTGIIDEDSYQWYCMNENVYTIPDDVDCLTLTGKKLREKMEARIFTEIGDFQVDTKCRVLTDAYFVPISCGYWFPNPESKWFNKNDFIIMNLQKNFTCSGILVETGERIETSLVRWHGERNGTVWLITQSGSSYRFSRNKD